MILLHLDLAHTLYILSKFALVRTLCIALYFSVLSEMHFTIMFNNLVDCDNFLHPCHWMLVFDVQTEGHFQGILNNIEICLLQLREELKSVEIKCDKLCTVSGGEMQSPKQTASVGISTWASSWRTRVFISFPLQINSNTHKVTLNTWFLSSS